MQSYWQISNLKKLVAGKELAIVTDHNGVLQEVRYAPTLTYSWRLFREQNQFQLEKLENKLVVRQQSITGVIRQSLFVDGKRAGQRQAYHEPGRNVWLGYRLCTRLKKRRSFCCYF